MKRTEYGFSIGSIEATAAAEVNGYGVVELKAGEWDLFVQSSPKSQRLHIQVFHRGSHSHDWTLPLTPKP